MPANVAATTNRRPVGPWNSALCSLVMALAAPAAYRHAGLVLAVAYLVLRSLLAVLVRHGRGIPVAPLSSRCSSADRC